MVKTVAVDFDGVIHYDPNGYDDIRIGGVDIPGAIDAIRKLQTQYAVAIVTARDVGITAHWLHVIHDVPAYADTTMECKFWYNQNVVLVTNRKVVASVYIDDRAIRFDYWDRTLAEVAERLAV